MKQLMFEREIQVLGDTFRRLMRRHAHTNLIKLINKTHPADMSVLFRYFDESEQEQLFDLMQPNDHTGEFLTELDESILQNLVAEVSADRIAMVDDVVDVIREEATEDFLKMAGVGKDREILLKSSWENAKSRLPWLFASWIGGIGAATIIGLYENLLETTLVLAAFIPVIIGMGGNIGTQTSTIIVRGLATGRVNVGNNMKILLKEIRVGLILGLFYGILLGLFTLTRFTDLSPNLGIIVGLSITTSMLIATTIGAFVPLFLFKLEIDPAVATGPLVTTSIDILGVTLYFLIASLFLPLA